MPKRKPSIGCGSTQARTIRERRAKGRREGNDQELDSSQPERECDLRSESQIPLDLYDSMSVEEQVDVDPLSDLPNSIAPIKTESIAVRVPWRSSPEQRLNISIKDECAVEMPKTEADYVTLLEPELNIQVLSSTLESVQAASRGKRGRRAESDSSSEAVEQRRKRSYTKKTDPPLVSPVTPLFPITPQLREKIKRMKQRMLATLKLSDDQLAERNRKRAQQTQASRQRSMAADETAYRRRECAKIAVRRKMRKEMETPEEIAARRATQRAERRRYVALRKSAETPEQREARLQYMRNHWKQRRPMKF